MRPHHGPALIDCPRGLGPALREYFTEFALREGVPVSGKPEFEFDSPSAAISHFVVRFPDGHRFQGFAYVDPTLTEADNEPGEGEEGEPSERVCSAIFAAAPASAEEARLLEQGYYQTLTRLGLPDPNDRFGRRTAEGGSADRRAEAEGPKPSTKASKKRGAP